MPPAVAAAAVYAGGTIAGGVIASRARGKATQAQLKANDEAIAYQKEQQASRQSRYDAAYEDYRKRYDDWLNQFFGGSAKPSAPATGGVHAASGGGGVPPMAAASGGIVGANAPGGQGMPSIADLIAGRGRILANDAGESGDLWGGIVANASQGIGDSILKNQKLPGQQITMQGAMQPGVDSGVVAPWQPAQMPNQPAPWNDWSKYGAIF